MNNNEMKTTEQLAAEMHRELTEKYETRLEIIERASAAFNDSHTEDSDLLRQKFPNGCTLKDAIWFFKVEDLKRQWLKDGCWDIEETEGYEDYSQELLEWRLSIQAEREEKWKAAAPERWANKLASEKRASAFPQIETEERAGQTWYADTFSTGGLTKREYFAAAAMQGEIASWSNSSPPSAEVLARVAVEYADALIEELNKESKQ